MKKRKRARGRGGFTLAETLLAVLILLMVSAITAAGIPAAKNAYEKVVLGANARILLSTSLTALRDELGTARDVEVSGNTVSYYSAKTHANSQIYLDTDPPAIMVRDYVGLEGSVIDPAGGTAQTTRRLVSDKAATRDLYVTYGSVTLNADKSMVTFSNVEVRRRLGNSVVASLDKLDIRLIANSI